MATAAKLTDDFLRCNICMEVFKNPSTLSCQHTFCRECLSSYIQSKPDVVRTKSVPCPSCRGVTVVPNPNRPVEEWAEQFKASFLIVGMMDSLHQPEKELMDSPSQPETKCCSVCKNTQSVSWYWCSECQAFFCGQCLVLHSRMPYSSNHEMTQHREGERVRKPFVCQEHDEKIKLFCKDCRKCLCTLCCSIYHRRCEVVVTLKEMLPVVKKETEDHQKNLSKMQEQKLRDQDDIKGKVELINERKTNVKEEIKEVFRSLRTILDQKERVLIDTVDDKLKGPIGQLKTEIENTEQDMNLLKKNSQAIQNALEQVDEVQLFYIYQSLDIPSQPSDTISIGSMEPSLCSLGWPCAFQAEPLQKTCIKPEQSVPEQSSYSTQRVSEANSYPTRSVSKTSSCPTRSDSNTGSYATRCVSKTGSCPTRSVSKTGSYRTPVITVAIASSYRQKGVSETSSYPTQRVLECFQEVMPEYLSEETEEIESIIVSNNKPDVAKISFIHDLHQLRKIIDEMEIRVTY